MDSFTLDVIARIKSDFTTKFGIPRQSGLAETESVIVFEPEYRDENALRGLAEYSYIWLLWGFSLVERRGFSPMVKPPRLGGNTRMGVFATRSPNRPNPIGLSSVKLLRLEKRHGLGTVLIVSGADLADGSPIYDVKPYLAYVDSHPDASDGFAARCAGHSLNVSFEESALSVIPEGKRAALTEALAEDPRPGYSDDPATPFGFEYAGFDVRFRVEGDKLSVYEIVPLSAAGRTPVKR